MAALKDLDSKALRFPFAGRVTFIRRATDGTDSKDPADTYTSGRTVMGVITNSYSLTQTALEDENSPYPAANYTTGATYTVSIGMRTEDPDLDVFIKGSKKTIEENVPVWHPDMVFTIADKDGAAVVEILDANGSPVVIGDDRAPLVRDFMKNSDYKDMGTETPTKSGEFMIDAATGKFTFSSADVGKQVKISCSLVADEAVKYTDSAQPKASIFHVIVTGPAEDYTQENPMTVTRDYDSMQLSGDYSPLPQQKAPGEKTLTLQLMKPRGNESVITTYIPEIVAIS